MNFCSSKLQKSTSDGEINACSNPQILKWFLIELSRKVKAFLHGKKKICCQDNKLESMLMESTWSLFSFPLEDLLKGFRFQRWAQVWPPCGLKQLLLATSSLHALVQLSHRCHRGVRLFVSAWQAQDSLCLYLPLSLWSWSHSFLLYVSSLQALWDFVRVYKRLLGTRAAQTSYNGLINYIIYGAVLGRKSKRCFKKWKKVSKNNKNKEKLYFHHQKMMLL